MPAVKNAFWEIILCSLAFLFLLLFFGLLVHIDT